MHGDNELTGSNEHPGLGDGQPHLIKIHFGGPMPFPFGNPFSPFADGPDSALGEPVMPHFLGLDEDPFGP